MNNADLYNAVLSGIAGSNQNVRVGVTLGADYTRFSDRAVILASAVDALIPTTTVTQADALLMTQVAAGLDFNRCLVGTTPQYSGIASDIAALWTEFRGRISGASALTLTIELDTIAQLRALPFNPDLVYVRRYGAVGTEYGGGWMELVPGSVAADDSGTFFVTSIGSRYARSDYLRNPHIVKIVWWPLDPTGTADGSVHLGRIFALGVNGIVQGAAGTYRGSDIHIIGPVTTRGCGVTFKQLSNVITPIFVLGSDDVTFEDCNFDGDRWNQVGTVADNPVFARQHTAINSGLDKFDGLKLLSCNFTGFFNATVSVIADNITIEKCAFTDSNYHPLFLGYHDGDIDIYCDGIDITDCTFERLGYKTGPADVREYGNDLPVAGTADAMLIRGQNVSINNCRFYDIDRLSIKFEILRKNYTISNCLHINSYPGNSAFGTIGFGLPPGYYTVGKWVPTDSDPTNIVISNDIARRPTATIGLAWANGVSISNAQYSSVSGLLDGGLAIANCRNIRVSNSSFSTSAPLRTLDVYNIAVGAGETPPPSANLYFVGVSFRSSNAGTPGTVYFQADMSHVLFSDCTIDPTYGAVPNHNAIYVTAYIIDDVVFQSCEIGRANFANNPAKPRTNFVWDNCTLEESLQVAGLTSFSLRRTRVRNNDKVAAFGSVSKPVGMSYFDDPEWYSFADGDTTPSIQGRRKFRTGNTAPTTITTLDDGVSTQEVEIVFDDAVTTLANSANFKLAGGINWTPTQYSSIRLVQYQYLYGATFWIESSRTQV